jgi:hypothetical protein
MEAEPHHLTALIYHTQLPLTKTVTASFHLPFHTTDHQRIHGLTMGRGKRKNIFLPRLTQKGLPWVQQNTPKLYQEPTDGDWDDPHTSSQVSEAHRGNRRTWHEEPLQREGA